MATIARGAFYVILAGAVSAMAGALISHVAFATGDPLKAGEAIPDFQLKDAAGKEHNLKQYEGKIVVFNFCTQECPFSRGADPDISAFAKTYQEKGVVFLGVDSNKDITVADIQAHIRDDKIPYPILKDEGNVFADAVGARVTPEIYIKGNDGKLVFHGPVDNRTGPNSPATEHYLKDALEALLAGKPVEKPTVKAWGCGIKRAR